MLYSIASKAAIYGAAGAAMVSMMDSSHAASLSGGDAIPQVQLQSAPVAQTSQPVSWTSTYQMPVPKPGGALLYMYHDPNDMLGLNKGEQARTRKRNAPPRQTVQRSQRHSSGHAVAVTGSNIPATYAPPVQASGLVNHGLTAEFITRKGERGPWDADEFRPPVPGEKITPVNAIPRAVGALETVSRVLGGLAR